MWNEADSQCRLSSSAPPPSSAEGSPRTLRSQLGPNTFLYGIFDTHNGTEGFHSILPQIADEIILAQLDDYNSDEEIKETLRNAFLTVEKTYTQTINETVAQRTSLQYDLSDSIDESDQKYINILQRLKNIDEELSIGITSVIALIHNEKLFVANIGNSRALLCKTDENGVLRVMQLSVDHSLTNEDELLRLSKIGLDTKKLREAGLLGNQSSTRCLGNYLIKHLYQAFPDLKTATGEPVIAVPEVHGPINLDQSCRFLVLSSDKLYINLQESIETEQVNKQLAQMIVEQFRVQTTLESVCQSVVDKIMNLYREYSQKTSKPTWGNYRNTLLIRNFNYPLPNAITPKLSTSSFETYSPLDTYNSGTVKSQDTWDKRTNEISESPRAQSHTGSNFKGSERITAYVDFSPYYQNVEIAKKNGTLPKHLSFIFDQDVLVNKSNPISK